MSCYMTAMCGAGLLLVFGLSRLGLAAGQATSEVKDFLDEPVEIDIPGQFDCAGQLLQPLT